MQADPHNVLNVSEIKDVRRKKPNDDRKTKTIRTRRQAMRRGEKKREQTPYAPPDTVPPDAGKTRSAVPRLRTEVNLVGNRETRTFFSIGRAIWIWSRRKRTTRKSRWPPAFVALGLAVKTTDTKTPDAHRRNVRSPPVVCVWWIRFHAKRSCVGFPSAGFRHGEYSSAQPGSSHRFRV